MPRKKKKQREKKNRNVYVIELDGKVLEDRAFARENPRHDPRKACLYVGMTVRSPDTRFEQHREGYKACKKVKKHGRRLRRDLYEHRNPMTYRQACLMEVRLAKELKAKGHAVWQK